MKKFRQYLKKEGYSNNTIDTHIKSVSYFLKWLDESVIEIDQVNYGVLLDYLSFLQNKSLSGVTINSYLKSTEYYLKFKGVEIDMIHQLRIRNSRKKVMISKVIEYDKLEKLYDCFPDNTKHQKRYRVILGLIVFQALNSRDLNRLRVQDIDIHSGAIYIPSTKTSNARGLSLHAKQIMPLNAYKEEVRGTFEGVEDDGSLFLTKQGNLHMVLHQMKVNLKKTMEIESLSDIRASVIHYWLKNHNLRQVQHWCGHKHVSSTEAYLDQELIELEDELMTYHPLG